MCHYGRCGVRKMTRGACLRQFANTGDAIAAFLEAIVGRSDGCGRGCGGDCRRYFSGMATTTLFEFIIVTTICKEETSQQNNTVEKSDVWRAIFGEKNLQFLTLFVFQEGLQQNSTTGC